MQASIQKAWSIKPSGFSSAWLLIASLLLLGLPISANAQVTFEQKSNPAGLFTSSSVTKNINDSISTLTPNLTINEYSFTHWTLNDVRENAPDGQAKNKISATITENTVAIAHYLATNQDSDSDGVPDWFEIRMFATLDHNGSHDGDGDGVTLADERQFGLAATIADDFLEGGASIRRSGLVFANFGGAKKLSVSSDPAGLFTSSETFPETNSSYSSTNLNGLTNGYYFSHWEVNGVRQADPKGIGLSKISLTMNEDKTVVAKYYHQNEDTDSDGLPDWFEWHEFGTLDHNSSSDPDGDGLLMSEERQFGLSAVIADDFLEGGASIRRSGLVFANFGGAKKLSVSSDPAGLFTSSETFPETNSSYSSTNLNGLTNGYYFSHWEVNGVRQADPKGIGLSKISLTMNEDKTVVAKYYHQNEDTDSDGLPDWFEWHEFGTLDHNSSSDPDGDGLLMSEERQFGLSAVIADDFLEGGGSIRRSGTLGYIEFQPNEDDDGDGLTKAQELQYGTSDDNTDSDGDGFPDGEEVTAGSNPANADSVPNRPPRDLNSTAVLAFQENQAVGTVIGEFNATDPDGHAITYHFLNGENNNSLFSLERNGTLKTATTFDYESNASSYTITVQVKDELNATTDGNFTVTLLDVNLSTPLKNSNFMTAINLWFSNQAVATDNYGHISDWNVSGVTNMAEAFNGRTTFNVDISSWDVSSVQNMNKMFQNAKAFNQPIGSWDTSKVKNMSDMFRFAWSFKKDISSWDTSSVTNMFSMFKGAHAFAGNIDKWNVDSVTKMTDMFWDSWGISNIKKGLIHETFSKNSSWPYNWAKFVPPRNFTSFAELSFFENLQVGSVVGKFNATDANNGTITYHFISGENNNSLFTLDTNGILKTATTFDYEINATSYTITVQAKDELSAAIEANFTVTLLDVYEPFRENHTVELNASVGMEMIWVNPGTFTMGQNNIADSSPEHNVTLTEGFYLGKYEMTQAQYEAVVSGNSKGLNPNPSNRVGLPNHPVEMVSYNNINTFLDLLSAQNPEYIKKGWRFALPTSAQWEFACRAGTSSQYFWGETVKVEKANYQDNGLQTTRVGFYESNHWGFHDMHGNVAEFVSDWHGSYQSSPKIDPTGPKSGTRRMFRGGSWRSTSDQLRSAARMLVLPQYTLNYVGFRLVLKKITQQPTNLYSTAALSFSENQTVGTVIGEFNATDPDGDAITYNFLSGENNNSLFTLDTNGTLKTATTFDYESNATSYTITVQAKDELNATTEGNFTVTLLDDKSDNPPSDLWLSNSQINENTAVGTEVAQVVPLDKKYAYKAGQGIGSHVVILRNASHMGVQFIKGEFLNVTLIGNGGTVNGVTIYRPQVNKGPTWLPLNGRGDWWERVFPGVSLVLEFGNEGVSLDGQTGMLSVNRKFDYETDGASHSLSVRAKREGMHDFNKSFTLTITDIFEDLDQDGTEDHLDDDIDGDGFTNKDELAYGSDPLDPNSVINSPPYDISMKGGEILENQSAGSLVAKFIGQDKDLNDTLTYSLVFENSDLKKEIIEEEEQVIDDVVFPFRLAKRGGGLRTRRELDYEVDDHNYTVRIRVTDDLNTSFEKSFIVHLRNVIEDMDGDKIEDAFDEDIDGDGYFNEQEIEEGTNPRDQYSHSNKPILQTKDALLNEDGSIDLSGSVFTDGNGKITDFGFVISSGISIDPKRSKVLWIRGVGEPESFKLKLTQSPYQPLLYIRAWAKNIAGYGIGPVRKVRIPEAPKHWWGEVQERTGGWKTSDWFGNFISYEKGWLYHLSLGWLYSSPASESSVWLWKDNRGWLWTKEELWPYLWSENTANWLYLVPGKAGEPSKFYDFTIEAYR